MFDQPVQQRPPAEGLNQQTAVNWPFHYILGAEGQGPENPSRMRGAAGEQMMMAGQHSFTRHRQGSALVDPPAMDRRNVGGGGRRSERLERVENSLLAMVGDG